MYLCEPFFDGVLNVHLDMVLVEHALGVGEADVDNVAERFRGKAVKHNKL